MASSDLPFSQAGSSLLPSLMFGGEREPNYLFIFLSISFIFQSTRQFPSAAAQRLDGRRLSAGEFFFRLYTAPTAYLADQEDSTLFQN